jgi:hypothetical protein
MRVPILTSALDLLTLLLYPPILKAVVNVTV